MTRPDRQNWGVTDTSTPKRDPLQLVAIETERYVSADGWDQPTRLFALVPTHELASSAPGLDVGGVDADHLSAVEQEGFAPDSDLPRALETLAWPPAVRGCALAVERLVVPPAAERDLPSDPAAASQQLQRHPDRQDVRLLVAVLRDGPSVCLIRQRSHDADNLVGTGPDLAPGLVAALVASLRDDVPE